MSATLIELENHPGLEHVRLYPPTGLTAQRWTVIEKSLAQLWEDLGRMTSILESARTVRARRSKPDDDDRTELTRLLREQPLEVSRQPIPLAQRQISGLGEAVEYVGLADTAERMHAAYPAVVEFLDAVDRINSLDRRTSSHRRRNDSTRPVRLDRTRLPSCCRSPRPIRSRCPHEISRSASPPSRTASSGDRPNSPNWLQYSRIGPTPSRPRPSSLDALRDASAACGADSHARRTDRAGGPASRARRRRTGPAR